MQQNEQILVVEDNPVTADTIRLFLESEGFEVILASNGQKGLELATSRTFDAAILDWMLPGMDGVTLCKKLRENQSLPIIMLTARSAEDDIIKGLEAGADDYIQKPFKGRELQARVRSALRRRHSFSDPGKEEFQLGELVINRNRHDVILNGESIELTRNEFRLLLCLASSPGRVFTRDQLIDAALGDDFDGYDRTIDAHISNLRKKLGDTGPRHRYVLTEIGIGYRFVQ